MHFLVSGGTGFLGSTVCRSLASSGHQLTLLVRPTSDIRSLALDASMCSTIQIENLNSLSGIDAILHAATHYGRKGASEREVEEVNFKLPMRLLDFALKNRVQSFLNVDTPIDATVSTYAKFKSQFRKELEGTSEICHRINLVLQYFYGENEPKGRLVRSLVEAALHSVEPFKLSPGEQKRDFIHVDDVASAISLIVERIDAIADGWKEFEIGTGRAVSLRELVDIIKANCPETSTDFEFGAFPYRENEQMLVVANTQEISALGWGEPMQLEQGIQKVIASCAGN